MPQNMPFFSRKILNIFLISSMKAFPRIFPQVSISMSYQPSFLVLERGVENNKKTFGRTVFVMYLEKILGFKESNFFLF